MRSFLYAVARLLGDVTAMRRGRYHKRMYNRLVGRHVVSRLWWR